MKCPKCSRNQRRGKEGMVCKSCSYDFLFDPKRDRLAPSTPLHDHLFRKIISHASANGTYYFTSNQFYSSARHLGQTSSLGCFIIFLIALLALLVGVVFEISQATLFGGFFLVIITIPAAISFIRGKGPKRKHWDHLVSRWLRAEGEIPGLIKSPALSTPPPQWKESDIYDYGVSGIILCDREEIVDWLIFNQFHTQTNTLILTTKGYPAYLLPVAQKLLKETPQLPFWLLHDPSTSPEAMKHQCPLQISEVIDLGLDSETTSRLTVLKKRFARRLQSSLALDVIPYRTLSAALGQCITNGVVLGSVLGTNTADADTDTSFG